MKIKFKESGGELFLRTNYFDMKLSKLRDVLIKKHDEINYSATGEKSPSGMTMEEKKYFLLERAYGTHRLILLNERTKSEDKEENIEEQENIELEPQNGELDNQGIDRG